MIVPQNRLIFWTGMVIIPFASAGFMLPETAGLSAVVMSFFIILVSTDGAMVLRKIKGISIEFPKVVRLSKNREGAISFNIRNSDGKKKVMRLGLAFPEELKSATDTLQFSLPAGGHTANASWSCTPVRRGSYMFASAYIEVSSALGFWGMRAELPANFEVRAYPDLSFERKNLAVLFLNRGCFGIHPRRQTGQGREFEKLREYVHGDSFEHIHWKVTAKRGRPVTKQFQVERTQEVYVIVDASRLSGRVVELNSIPETILDRYITAAMVTGAAAVRQGDLFGAITFSDSVHSFVRAKGGRQHYRNCREALYKLQPRAVTPDFAELCAFTGLRLRRRSLLIFLTNLDDPLISENFFKSIDMIRRSHIVVTAALRPEGIQPVFSDADIDKTEDIYKALAGHMLWHNLLELEKALKHKGVHFRLLDNEKLCPDLVSQYMEIKQRQLI